MEREQRNLHEQILSPTPPTPIDVGAEEPTFEVSFVGVEEGVNADGSEDGSDSTAYLIGVRGGVSL